MQVVRKIIKIDDELCDGCGQCVPDCAEGSLRIINGKARLIADKLCDGLGACLGSCPTGALQIIERNADEFDEEAVEEYLAASQSAPCQAANIPVNIPSSGPTDSALTHWPVQIRLIPPHAPFLQNCDLLVAADCTAVAAQNFQKNYLEGKTVMMGCPKFDDTESYVQRFTDIIRTCNLKSLTVLIMEVPCCSAMNVIIKKAIEKAGKSVPVEQITISTRGKELERRSW